MGRKFIPLEEMDIVFVDTETTGLDPAKHEIVEISMIRQDRLGRITSSFTTKIRPLNITDAEPRALEINGYNEKDWEEAPFFPEVKDKILSLWKDALFCGHNAKFDHDMLVSEFKRCGVNLNEVNPGYYHMLDTIPLAYAILGRRGLIQYLNLKHIRPRMGILNEGEHRAEKDNEDARFVWNTLQGLIDRDVDLFNTHPFDFPAPRLLRKLLHSAIRVLTRWSLSLR